MSGMDLANFAIVVGGFLISVLGLMLAVSLRQTDRESRGFFLLFFLLLVAYTASGVVCQLSSEPLLSQIALFAESLFSSLLIPPFTVYLLRCVGRSWKQSRLFYMVNALWAVYFLLLVITQFTTWIYYYTPDDVYHRGPWYPLLLVPPILQTVVNLIAVYRYRAALTQRQRVAFSLYFAIPLVCMVIQICFYGLLLIVLGTSVAVLIMFVILLIDQMERSIRQSKENARQQASIAVLQMRPHFICNTMMSIYYLIAQDPDKAQQVTLDFTAYLRNNFTALAKEDTIPFTEELEHTRAYLAVEMVRYEDKLFVEMDTPCTRFRIPPLTLQPIVENAILHGVSPDLEPLYLTVLTRETESGFEIVVEDTGPGYTPADDKEPHIALENIRERLQMMCGATLEIAPREAGGTVVTVTVPDSREASRS